MSLAASSNGLTFSELCFDANKITIEQSITALRERGIIAAIDSSQRYQITFGLFRSWIRRYLLGVED